MISAADRIHSATPSKLRFCLLVINHSFHKRVPARCPRRDSSPFAALRGRQIKDATGLYFYNARYYDPALGRFTQPDTIVPDPANPQSLNRYAYVLNNPLKYTDPSGHFFFLALGIGLAGGAIGGAVYGYGSQVVDNLQQGMDLGQALTTNINPGKIGLYAGVGASMGGVGGAAVGAAGEAAIALGLVKTAEAGSAATAAACADLDCGNELQSSAVALQDAASKTNALLQRALSSGEFEDTTISTSVGQIQIAGQVTANGASLQISDAMIYPVGEQSVDLGTQWVMALIREVGIAARQLGFETMSISGYRVSGANPGHTWDRTFDLLRKTFTP